MLDRLKIWRRDVRPFIPSDALSENVAALMGNFRQGDLLPEIKDVPARGPYGFATLAAPNGVVIVSQTCDVVQDRVHFVHVAPRVKLDAEKSRDARSGRRIRYVWLPSLGEQEFADIAQLAAVHKSVVARCVRVEGITTDREISNFGKAVARSFNRFAYPDPVSHWLNPLAERIRSRAAKVNSPEGRLLNEVLQYRVKSTNGWTNPPYDLHLVIVVKPTTLPIFPSDAEPQFDERLQSRLYDSGGSVLKQPAEIASEIISTTDPGTRYWLWSALGDAWASKCKIREDAPLEFQGAVSGMTSEVVSADDITLTMLNESEIMDLDYLSDSSDDED